MATITIILDMDGTLAATYSVPNWLEKLRKFDPSPYAEAKPIERGVGEAVRAIRAKGVEVRVVTWLSKESNPEYDKLVRKAKREWLKRNGIEVDSVRCVPYGTPKAYYRNPDTLNILFDDDERVREGFETFNDCMALDPAEESIVAFLTRLME